MTGIWGWEDAAEEVGKLGALLGQSRVALAEVQQLQCLVVILEPPSIEEVRHPLTEARQAVHLVLSVPLLEFGAVEDVRLVLQMDFDERLRDDEAQIGRAACRE